jgi:hypothetical protein
MGAFSCIIDDEVYKSNTPIHELQIPRGSKVVHCSRSYLTELHVPGSISKLVCDHGVINPHNFMKIGGINIQIF